MSKKSRPLLNGRYRLGDVLGKGGMAIVYAATDTVLKREVAIKVFTASSAGELIQRQEDEVTLLASLSHHGLVTLLDAGIDRSDRKNVRVFFVMELVTGADLSRTLQAGPLAQVDIALIGYDIAEALQYVHSRDVVHRDIKPSNILFVDYFDDGTRARAKLTDFGIAHRGIEHLANEKVTTGTAAYLSPEQVAREPIGPPSDIYALGLVLLECFTNQLAYPGQPVVSAMARLENQPAIPGSIPTQWRAILASMTQRDPALRPNAKELVLAMRRILVAAMAEQVGLPTAISTSTSTDTGAPIGLVTTERTADNGPAESDPLEAQIKSPFDRITAVAARVLSAPIAIMIIVDSGREWFKARFDIDLAQIETTTGRYNSATLYNAAWIPDGASASPHVLADPGVAAQFGFDFYVSVPVMTRDGTQIGVLCVLDYEKRGFGNAERRSLNDLAAMAMTELESQLRQYLVAKYA